LLPESLPRCLLKLLDRVRLKLNIIRPGWRGLLGLHADYPIMRWRCSQSARY
jgi:hypothetical protein